VTAESGRTREGDGWHEFVCVVCRKPGECDGDCAREPSDAEHVHFDAPCWEVGPPLDVDGYYAGLVKAEEERQHERNERHLATPENAEPYPCGHLVRTKGCGGCDPGAVEFEIPDGADLSRGVEPYRVAPEKAEKETDRG
jgi:hypothetical protein